MRRLGCILIAATVGACAPAHTRDNGGGDGDGDGDGDLDASVTSTDAATTDATMSTTDGGPTPDAGFSGRVHVHILIDNFCNTAADPAEITVQAGDTVQLSHHNHSVDYNADVWLSYGGGYLGLVPGDTWDDQFEFCTSPEPYTAYADISIEGGGSDACPKHRLLINCL